MADKGESTKVADNPSDTNPANNVKNKRKQLRRKVTRSINRIKEALAKKDQGKRRFQKELEQLRLDYNATCDLHGQLYEYAEDSQFAAMDAWENELTNDVFSIEEEVETYLSSVVSNGTQMEQSHEVHAGHEVHESHASNEIKAGHGSHAGHEVHESHAGNGIHADHAGHTVHANQAGQSGSLTTTNATSGEAIVQQEQQSGQTSGLQPFASSLAPPLALDPVPKVCRPIDAWIDDLTEFQETVLPKPSTENLTVAEALFKLEASKDIPSIKLPMFDGKPLQYTDFIERFKIHIHNKVHLTDDTRMIQLKMHLAGEAERAISGLGCKGVMYATALKTLKEQFGQPSIIARFVVNKLAKGDRVLKNNRQALREFSLDIINCLTTLCQINYYADVNANDNLRKIIMRLPDNLIERWKGVAADICEKEEVPTLQHISDFIRKRVKAEFDPDFGDIQREMRSTRTESGEVARGVHATQRGHRTKKCYVCEGVHEVLECPTLVDSTVEERFGFVKNARLCFSCLNKGHMTRECRSRKRCEKNGCQRFHHPLLHSDPPTASGVASVLDRNGMMPVVRIRFRAANGRIREGNALIDSGAGSTVIRRDFAKALGLPGKRERIDLAVVGGETLKQTESRRLRFWISALNAGEEFVIEAHELEKTVLSVPALDRQWLRSFSHLNDVDFPHKAGPVDLILGVQYSHLHAEMEVRQGLPFEPVGKRTKLGWFVIGSDNLRNMAPSCSVSFMQPLNLERFYELETLGIQAPDCSCPKEVISSEDKEALKLMENSCVHQDSRYTVCLPWKKNKLLLPNNYPLAEKRLFALERNLLKNEEKARVYDEAIMAYEKNGWARALSKEELEADIKPVYYLPHHGVYRPDKKSTPLRIVFDPASQYQGTSLNSFLHKGPCLIGNLLGVLLRFREEPIGFIGDISKMYLQICLPTEDTQVHRFLWRNLDVSRKPTTYALQRVTFGDKPSPDMTSYVMLRIAKDNEKQSPSAALILRRDRYMDDLIHSCSTVEEAVQRIAELDTVLATGSFKIKEWICSSKVVRKQLRRGRTSADNRPTEAPCDVASEATAITLDGEEGTKTLGIGWNPNTDFISFVVGEIKVEELTKRKVLSNISRLYDPLGLLSAVTIKARVALQNIWRSKQYDWDDPLPEEMNGLWSRLFEEVKRLQNIEFPRCLRPERYSGTSELHVFADASASAYGAAAYLLSSTSHDPGVRLISAKARVTPLRQTTTPRLELMAALVGSRLAKTIYDEFKNKPSSVTLWSDSEIVLHWLFSESAVLKPFVGVRVAEIQSTWDPQAWRHVPTELNPADDLSRSITVEEVNGRWMNGPPFLKKPKDVWPPNIRVNIEDDPERKKAKFVGAVNVVAPVLNASDYSSWTKLTRVTAYIQRFVSNMKAIRVDRAELKTSPLEPWEIEFAERYWIHIAQKSLVDWNERFQDLAPFIRDDIIRVGGRLKRSQLHYEQIHPILLPADHHISTLIMEDAHKRVFHAGCKRTLSESRQQFWIVRGRSLVKKIIRNCVLCRKLRQPPHTTLMADLPPERIKPFSPPFTVTGIDLFGPFNLKYGRNKSIKAWGALFTCATVRAIHLEIVESLSTESFLQALRRFASQHGWPTTVISDNGKSFVGTEKELRKLLVEGRRQIQDFAVLHKMRWIFTTPLSPHQGGIYESLIKQTKQALRVAVGTQILSWNEMATVFAEVKSLINSRPLGYPSNDPNDLKPLTPNHFLLGRALS